QVRLAQQQLDQVFGFLSADRGDLAAAMQQLAATLKQVKTFIASNRHLIRTNVNKLSSITQTLVDQRESLAEALDIQPLAAHIQPLAADNALNTSDARPGTLVGRGNLNEISRGKRAKAAAATPAMVAGPAVATAGGSICALANASAAAPSLATLCRQVPAG